MRRLTYALAALVILPILPAPVAASAVCADPVEVPLVGPACREGGLLNVLGPDGRSLGTTHGVDPAGDGPGIAAAGPVDPACMTGAAGEYYIQPIYARGSNDADQFATRAPQIRDLVRNANGLIQEAGAATGGSTILKVRCTGGVIDVRNEVLPTPKASATFANIVTDLTSKGYTNGRVKHWVFYDEPLCSCGVGHIYEDDSLTVNNLNNGNGAALFAVSWSITSTRVWAHEISHNLGAVQPSAPRTTSNGLDGGSGGYYHCIDGLDTMCYNDGGPNGAAYSTASCAVEVYDCGKNDYFHVSPPAGSYLATHWNVGSSLNRYLQFGVRPTMTSLSCTSPTIAGESATTCTFAGTDSDSSGITYTIAWGDGATTCIPGCTGYVPPGTTRTATHTYAVSGTKTVSVTATDNAATPLTSNPMTASVAVQARPQMNALSCTSPVAVGGAGTTCSYRASDADSAGVRYTIAWGDGTTQCDPGCAATVAPGVTRSLAHAYATPGLKTVSVTATDANGLVSTALATSVEVRSELVPPSVTFLEPRAGNVYQGCTFAPAPVATKPIFLASGCADVAVSDLSGVTQIRVFFAGAQVGNDVSPADGRFTVVFPAGTPALSVPLTVTAQDGAGNTAIRTILVDVAA